MLDEAISLVEAEVLTGVSRRKLERQFRAWKIPRYLDPLDRRRMLVKKSDLEQHLMLKPFPLDRGRRPKAQPSVAA